MKKSQKGHVVLLAAGLAGIVQVGACGGSSHTLQGGGSDGGGNTGENELGRQRSLPEEEKDRGPDRGR